MKFNFTWKLIWIVVLQNFVLINVFLNVVLRNVILLKSPEPQSGCNRRSKFETIRPTQYGRQQHRARQIFLWNKIFFINDYKIYVIYFYNGA